MHLFRTYFCVYTCLCLYILYIFTFMCAYNNVYFFTYNLSCTFMLESIGFLVISFWVYICLVANELLVLPNYVQQLHPFQLKERPSPPLTVFNLLQPR